MSRLKDAIAIASIAFVVLVLADALTNTAMVIGLTAMTAIEGIWSIDRIIDMITGGKRS